MIRSHYGHGFIKQYVRDHLLLRTEAATNDVRDYAVPKAIDHLPQLRQKQAAILDTYLDVQQDILETFVDRGQLRALSQPTVLPSGKRIPGLRLDHPRLLAVMQTLVRFAHLAAGRTFRMAELHAPVAAALDHSTADFRLSSLRYEVSKLRAKGLVEKLPHSRRYRLRPEGYRLCLVFLKLFERIYAPLTAGLLRPVVADAQLPQPKLLSTRPALPARQRGARPSGPRRRTQGRLMSQKRVQNSRYRPHNGLMWRSLLRHHLVS